MGELGCFSQIKDPKKLTSMAFYRVNNWTRGHFARLVPFVRKLESLIHKHSAGPFHRFVALPWAGPGRGGARNFRLILSLRNRYYFVFPIMSPAASVKAQPSQKGRVYACYIADMQLPRSRMCRSFCIEHIKLSSNKCFSLMHQFFFVARRNFVAQFGFVKDVFSVATVWPHHSDATKTLLPFLGHWPSTAPVLFIGTTYSVYSSRIKFRDCVPPD